MHSNTNKQNEKRCQRIFTSAWAFWSWSPYHSRHPQESL